MYMEKNYCNRIDLISSSAPEVYKQHFREVFSENFVWLKFGETSLRRKLRSAKFFFSAKISFSENSGGENSGGETSGCENSFDRHY